MSTATEQTHAATAQTVEPRSPLDAAIEMTKHRQSIWDQAAVMLEVRPDKVCDLLRNMWKQTTGKPELTNAELFVAVCLIVKYDLDPFTKEIYAARDSKGKIMVIVGIDGWIKIIHRTDDYDGHTQDVHFDENGKLEYVDTTIYSKSRKYPTTYRGYESEYAKLGGFMRGAIPIHMLRLFSFRHAARFFTPLGGSIVTEEEKGWRHRSDGGEVTDDPAGDALKAAVEETASRQSPQRDPTRAIHEQDQRTAAAMAAKTPPPPTLQPDDESFSLSAEPEGEVNLQVESESIKAGFLTSLKRLRNPVSIDMVAADAEKKGGSGDLFPEHLVDVLAACEGRKAELQGQVT